MREDIPNEDKQPGGPPSSGDLLGALKRGGAAAAPFARHAAGKARLGLLSLFSTFVEKILGPLAPRLQANKPLLFALLGFAGGFTGALAAEILPIPMAATKGFAQLVATGLWTAVAAAALAVALSLAEDYHARRLELSRQAVVKALMAGAAAGALAGMVAEWAYGPGREASALREFLLRPACWAAMGALLGWRMAAVVPNLGRVRGVTAGLLGGFVGGLGFVFLGVVLPQFIGRMVGFGIVGGMLGIAIVAAEALFRSAELVVNWAPNETTRFTLGPQPIRVGGGDDHVLIPGLPEGAFTLTLKEGKILWRDERGGKTTELKDASRVKLGAVELVVHARAGSPS